MYHCTDGVPGYLLVCALCTTEHHTSTTEEFDDGDSNNSMLNGRIDCMLHLHDK